MLQIKTTFKEGNNPNAQSFRGALQARREVEKRLLWSSQQAGTSDVHNQYNTHEM